MGTNVNTASIFKDNLSASLKNEIVHGYKNNLINIPYQHEFRNAERNKEQVRFLTPIQSSYWKCGVNAPLSNFELLKKLFKDEVQILLVEKNKAGTSSQDTPRTDEYEDDSSAIDLKADNWSRQIEEGWWEWGIYIVGEDADLDKIQCVEYILHESFPNRVRKKCDRSDDFVMVTQGWGTFQVKINVYLKDGTTLKLTHDLHFVN
jgi:hypothetical protein